MNKRSSLLLFAAGFILTGFGVALVVFSPRTSQPAKAADTYSMTWKATKVMAARALYEQADTTKQARISKGQTGFAAIGVSEWSVDGTIPGGGGNFHETWSLPVSDLTALHFKVPMRWFPSSPSILDRGCALDGIDQSQFLAGCYVKGTGNPDNGADQPVIGQFQLMSLDPASINSARGRANGSSGGVDNGSDQKHQTDSCSNHPFVSTSEYCILSSGAYGFLLGGTSSANDDPMNWYGGGMLMPLEWDVTGTIN